MSMNVSGRISENQGKTHLDYLNLISAWKNEVEFPFLLNKKLTEIVEEYYQLKPQMMRKQNQMKILFKYNEKLVMTVQQFISHEKKIVERYNALCKLYITSFEKYCTSKNWDVNFNIKPIRSLFQKFSIKDWKFQIEQNEYQVQRSYHERLYEVICRYFINGKGYLERLLQKVINRRDFNDNVRVSQQISQIQKSINKINESQITMQNMFEMLQNRKKVQLQIRELQQIFDDQSFKNDANFIDEVTNIHSMLLKPQPQRLIEYLRNESIIIKKNRKKSHNYLQNLYINCSEIQNENADLKTKIEQIMKDKQEIQLDRMNIKRNYEYLQLQTQSSKKNKMNNLNNSVMMSDVGRNGDDGHKLLKQSQKKLESKIAELQTEIKTLKSGLLEKQTKLNSALEDIQKNKVDRIENIDDMKKKLQVQLQFLGTKQELSGKSIQELLQKLYEKIHKNVSQTTNNYLKKNSIVNIEVDDQILGKEELKQSQINSEILYSQTKNINSNLLSNNGVQSKNGILRTMISSNNQQIPENEVQLLQEFHEQDQKKQKTINSINQVSLMNKKTSNKESLSIKRTSSSPYNIHPQNQLLSISEKKSMEQESKHYIDSSKQFRDRSLNDDKGFDKNSLILKEQQDILKMIAQLKQQKNSLLEQIEQLKQQLQNWQSKLAQRQKMLQKSIMSSIQGEIKNLDSCHAQQIQTLCQSIAKQLFKLDGEQFEKLISNMQQAMKICRASDNCSSKKKSNNIDEIPVLSKNLQEQNLFKSDLFGFLVQRNKEDDTKNRLKGSQQRDRSMKLAIQSGEVKLLVKMQKSIYFGKKQQINVKESHEVPQKNLSIQNQNREVFNFDQDIRIQKDDQFINIVNDFEQTTRKKEKNGNSQQHSLKLSQTNMKNSFQLRQEDMKSSLKLISPKLLHDTDLLMRIQKKIEDIKDNNQLANDFYWLYRKYKQSIQALQRTQALLRRQQLKKENCMNNLAKEDGLSKHKLEQNIYFLQQRVIQLENQLQVHKEEYENNISDQMEALQRFKVEAMKAMKSMGDNFFKEQI